MNYITQGLRSPQSGTHVVNDISTIEGLEIVFANTVAVAIGIGGIILFIMLIIGGFKYLTAAGDPQKIESAQKTLTSAILGLVLVALAYLILVFISTFTGVDVTIFDIVQ